MKEEITLNELIERITRIISTIPLFRSYLQKKALKTAVNIDYDEVKTIVLTLGKDYKLIFNGFDKSLKYYKTKGKTSEYVGDLKYSMLENAVLKKISI